jgi:hypothetical protein
MPVVPPMVSAASGALLIPICRPSSSGSPCCWPAMGCSASP